MEREFKNMLTKEEYERLLQAFTVKKEDRKQQINTYWDTETFTLREHGAALRTRKKPGTAELTLKEQHADGILEWTDALDEKTYEQILVQHPFGEGEAITRLENTHNIIPDQLRKIGELTTLRVELPYKRGLLVFDESHYGQTVDFEIEYEVENWSEGRQAFTELLRLYQIPERPADKKIARALRAYEVSRGEGQA